MGGEVMKTTTVLVLSALLTDSGRGPYAPEGPPTWVWLFFAGLAVLYVICWLVLYINGPKMRRELTRQFPDVLRQTQRWLKDPDYYKKK